MKKIKEYFPIWTRVVYVICAACAVLYAVFRLNGDFAEFFNRNISHAFRFLFAKVTGIFPFSVVEFFLFFSPVIFAYVLYYVVRAVKRNDVACSVRYLARILAVVCFLFSSFVLLYSPAYSAVTVAEKTSLDTENITAFELYDTMNFLTEEINSLTDGDNFIRSESGATFMPESLNKTAKKICDSYDEVNLEYSLFNNMKTVVKPVILSPLMTYTHISGFYSFYTGEVNINTNYPDYIVVSTVAHELAHQRGIAREDEASFCAYLALTSSDDPYLKYSGYLDVYSYVSNALYSTDKELWKECRGRLSDRANDELTAYSDFFNKYRESTASKVSESVNNAFLQSQGEKGTVSYDLVTELVVAHTARNGKK